MQGHSDRPRSHAPHGNAPLRGSASRRSGSGTHGRDAEHRRRAFPCRAWERAWGGATLSRKRAGDGWGGACQAKAITFIGPRPEVLEKLGDKVTARRIAQQANVPVLAGSSAAVQTIDEARGLADKLGYPLMVKAAMGGGGRGMRVVL